MRPLPKNMKAVSKIKRNLTRARIELDYLLKNRRAAAIFEYILVIVIVVIIGSIVIGVIQGENGIASIFDGLLDKFRNLVGLAPNTPAS